MNDPIDSSVSVPRPDLKWYMVSSRSKFENKAKASILAAIKKEAKESFFGQVVVPEASEVHTIKGVKKTTVRTLYPNYLLVQMVLSPETLMLVKNASFVTGFVGDIKNLTPLTESEVQKILSQMQAGTKVLTLTKFKEGEEVHITDGPFSSFTGIVEEIKHEKQKLKVLVSIFGRATPVELDYSQVTK